ncbi:MAG: lysylphosphatidylglycerol synthase transmembrane domain-containing protein [Gemmatimonadota bacterium]
MTDESLPKKRRSLFDWKAVVGVAISVALLWYALRNVDPNDVFAELRRADPLFYIAAVVAATAVFPLRAWRWRTLVEPTAPDTRFYSRFAATTIGFMGNNILPARVGEFARAYAFAKMEKITIVGSFGSLVVERLFDAIAVVGLLFVAMSLPGVPDVTNVGGRDLTALVTTLAILVVIGIVLGVSLVLAPARTVAFVEKNIARFLPRTIRRPFVDALEAFLSGFTALRSPVLLSAATVQTIVLWLFNAVGFWLAFNAFGIDVGLAGALLLQSIVALAVSIPSGPGFFGPFEAAAVFVLEGAYGVAHEKAVSFAIAFHIGGFIPVTVIGLYYAWRLGISLREVEESEEIVEEEVERTLPHAADV